MAAAYKLTTAVIGPGSLPGAGYYRPGVTLALTPAAAPGAVFSGFSGDGVGTAVRTVLMDADKGVIATFSTASDSQTIADLYAQSMVVQAEMVKLMAIFDETPPAKTFDLTVNVTGNGVVTATVTPP